MKCGPVGMTLTLSSSMTASAVSIHVADVGPGILPDRLESIFAPADQLTSGLASGEGCVGRPQLES